VIELKNDLHGHLLLVVNLVGLAVFSLCSCG
jgi:hypothetical protein